MLEAVLAPGEVGVYRVKLRVPDQIKTDTAVAVTLSINGVESPFTTIAVVGAEDQ